MKKNSGNQDSKALAVVKEFLPATITTAFTEAEMGEFNRRLQGRLRTEREFLLIGRFLTRGFGLALGAPAVACLAAGAMPWGIALGGAALTFGYFGTGVSKSMRRTFNEEVQYTKKNSQKQLGQKQEEFSADQKKRILTAAESHIARGNSLGAEDLSWLVALNPASLEAASEKLAITVLQARKALAYVRNENLDAEGGKPVVDPAITFASLEIKPDTPQNRLYLREQLVKADTALTEDKIEGLQKAEFVEEPKRKTVGTLRSLLEFFIPFADLPLAIEFRTAQMPALKPVDLISVKPAADFVRALVEYETQNPPLDLPAMRGWNGGKRKSLAVSRVLR